MWKRNGCTANDRNEVKKKTQPGLLAIYWMVAKSNHVDLLHDPDDCR